MTTQDIKATEDYNSIGHWNPDDGSDFIKNTHIPWLTNFVKKNVKAGVKGKWDKVIQRAIALSYRFYITSNASGQDVLREITGYGRSEVVSPRRLVQFCRAEWGGPKLRHSLYAKIGLCCTNELRDSFCESSMIYRVHE